MPGLTVREFDSYDAVVRKFKRLVEKAGILSDIRKKEFYEKPSVRRKKKSIAARKRLTKKLSFRKEFN